MLMTARDIVTRLPDADEKRIRLELSGNLCRCTGYVGIVEAVQSALATVQGVRPRARATGSRADRSGRLASSGHAAGLFATFGHRSRLPGAATVPRHSVGEFRCHRLGGGRTRRRGVASVVLRPLPARRGLALLRRSRSGDALHARRAPDQADAQAAAPRARSTSSSVRSSARSTAFSTSQRDDDALPRRGARRRTRRQEPVERARDHRLRRPSPWTRRRRRSTCRSSSCCPGALAQFSRSGLVKDVADHLTRIFAQNLEARLSGATGRRSARPRRWMRAPWRASAIWARIRAFFGKTVRPLGLTGNGVFARAMPRN